MRYPACAASTATSRQACGQTSAGLQQLWEASLKQRARIYVERRAPAEELEEAQIEATLAAHRAWVAAGRPGAVSHEEAMAELLGGSL
jgi:hypothetical protein